MNDVCISTQVRIRWDYYFIWQRLKGLEVHRCTFNWGPRWMSIIMKMTMMLFLSDSQGLMSWFDCMWMLFVLCSCFQALWLGPRVYKLFKWTITTLSGSFIVTFVNLSVFLVISQLHLHNFLIHFISLL